MISQRQHQDHGQHHSTLHIETQQYSRLLSPSTNTQSSNLHFPTLHLTPVLQVWGFPRDKKHRYNPDVISLCVIYLINIPPCTPSEGSPPLPHIPPQNSTRLNLTCSSHHWPSNRPMFLNAALLMHPDSNGINALRRLDTVWMDWSTQTHLYSSSDTTQSGNTYIRRRHGTSRQNIHKHTFDRGALFHVSLL